VGYFWFLDPYRIKQNKIIADPDLKRWKIPYRPCFCALLAFTSLFSLFTSYVWISGSSLSHILLGVVPGSFYSSVADP
jgi:hypothetical protein